MHGSKSQSACSGRANQFYYPHGTSWVYQDRSLLRNGRSIAICERQGKGVPKFSKILQISAMNRRFRIILLTSFLVVLGGILRQVVTEVEPTYHHRPASAWLMDYSSYRNSFAGSVPIQTPAQQQQLLAMGKAAETAIREMGTNLLPVLLRMATARHSALKQKLLYWEPQNSVLLALKGFLPLRPTAHEKHRMAEHAFQVLGPAATSATPVLIGLLRSKDNEVTASAARIISFIGPGARQAVPALMQAAQNSDPYVRSEAAFTLGAIGHSAEEAVDVLIALLDDEDSNVSFNALQSLGSIRARPEAVIPLLRAVLIQPKEAQSTYDVAITGLGKFGLRAQSAAPLILPFLTNDVEFLRRSATNTLRQIGCDIAIITAANWNDSLSPTSSKDGLPPSTGP